jgi:hypothetical protein
VEQAGSMGERRAVPSDDRQTLDPVFRIKSKNCVLKCAIWTEFSLDGDAHSGWRRGQSHAGSTGLTRGKQAPVRQVGASTPARRKRPFTVYACVHVFPEAGHRDLRRPRNRATGYKTGKLLNFGEPPLEVFRIAPSFSPRSSSS